MWMNILCKVFVKVVQLCDTKKVYKKCPRKSQFCLDTASRVVLIFSCVLKVLKKIVVSIIKWQIASLSKRYPNAVEHIAIGVNPHLKESMH